MLHRLQSFFLSFLLVMALFAFTYYAGFQHGVRSGCSLQRDTLQLSGHLAHPSLPDTDHVSHSGSLLHSPPSPHVQRDTSPVWWSYRSDLLDLKVRAARADSFVLRLSPTLLKVHKVQPRTALSLMVWNDQDVSLSLSLSYRVYTLGVRYNPGNGLWSVGVGFTFAF